MKENKQNDKAKNAINVKALVVLDHENFMLSINDTIQRINQ